MMDDSVAVILARLEIKLDQALSGVADHEARLRSLESRGTVTGKQLWGGLVGSVTAATGIIAILSLFVH